MRMVQFLLLIPLPGRIPILCVSTVLAGITATSAGPMGPGELPERLAGLWKVSLCIMTGHCWIRFENPSSGEVHTLGRYQRGMGGRWSWRELRWAWPNARVSGVQWDMELPLEDDVRDGRYLVLSVFVQDPPIYRGADQGFGHGLWNNNCATFARDAWHYYSGEAYALPQVHAPDDLLREVIARHPEVSGVPEATRGR